MATRVRSALATVVGWLLLVVALTPLFPMSDTVIAIGPPEKLLRGLPEGEMVTLAAGSVSLALAVETPAQVRSLYRAGAWLVLPATRGACIEQARAEQDGAEQRQFHARHLGIEARHVYVHR